LKLKHIYLHEFPNHKDTSSIGSTVCNSALMYEEGNPRITDNLRLSSSFSRITQYDTIGHSMLRSQINFYVTL
jgi:hypothetical protein